MPGVFYPRSPLPAEATLSIREGVSVSVEKEWEQHEGGRLSDCTWENRFSPRKNNSTDKVHIGFI